jgi:hypothetical protein
MIPVTTFDVFSTFWERSKLVLHECRRVASQYVSEVFPQTLAPKEVWELAGA